MEIFFEDGPGDLLLTDFSCKDCGRNFERACELAAHQRTHRNGYIVRKIFLHQILKVMIIIFDHPVPIIPLVDPVIQNVEEEVENNHGNEENEEEKLSLKLENLEENLPKSICSPFPFLSFPSQLSSFSVPSFSSHRTHGRSHCFWETNNLQSRKWNQEKSLLSFPKCPRKESCRSPFLDIQCYRPSLAENLQWGSCHPRFLTHQKIRYRGKVGIGQWRGLQMPPFSTFPSLP